MPHAPQPLLIIGASARAAAQSAARAGYEVTAIDLFADDDLAACAKVQRSRNYPHDLPALAATCANGPWLYTGGLENHSSIVAQISHVRPLSGNGPDILQRVRNPVALQSALAHRGLPWIPTQSSASKLPHDGTWLRKPLRSSGGSRVEVLRDEDHGLGASFANRDRYFYQQFIAGCSAAAVFVADGHRATLLGITAQLIGQPWTERPFQYAGSIGPLDVSPSVREQIIACGAALAAEFGLRGLFGIDGIVDSDNKFYAVEVNPRYTASCEIVEAMLQSDADCANLIAMHIAACIDGNLPSLPISAPSTADICHGKLIVFARNRLHVDETLHAFIAGQNRSGLHIADMPPIGTTIDVGDPAFTLLTSAASHSELRDKLAIDRSQIAEQFGC